MNDYTRAINNNAALTRALAEPPQALRGWEHHRFPAAIAINPDVKFVVEPVPYRDFAATALAKARDDYRRRHPDADMDNLVWKITLQ